MKHKFLMKFSLLSVFLVLASAASISSAIPLMRDTFIDQSLASIEVIMMHSLMCTLFVVLSIPISKKIGAK